jgi:hypothetical protein
MSLSLPCFGIPVFCRKLQLQAQAGSAIHSVIGLLRLRMGLVNIYCSHNSMRGIKAAKSN